MFAAYIDGGYYSLKDDIPAFNGFAELAPAANTRTTIFVAKAADEFVYPNSSSMLFYVNRWYFMASYLEYGSLSIRHCPNINEMNSCKE